MTRDCPVPCGEKVSLSTVGAFFAADLKDILSNAELQLGEQFHVLVLNKLVPVHPTCLMQPQTHEVHRRLHALCCGEEDALEGGNMYYHSTFCPVG